MFKCMAFLKFLIQWQCTINFNSGIGRPNPYQIAGQCQRKLDNIYSPFKRGIEYILGINGRVVLMGYIIRPCRSEIKQIQFQSLTYMSTMSPTVSLIVLPTLYSAKLVVKYWKQECSYQLAVIACIEIGQFSIKC